MVIDYKIIHQKTRYIAQWKNQRWAAKVVIMSFYTSCISNTSRIIQHCVCTYNNAHQVNKAIHRAGPVAIFALQGGKHK